MNNYLQVVLNPIFFMNVVQVTKQYGPTYLLSYSVLYQIEICSSKCTKNGL